MLILTRKAGERVIINLPDGRRVTLAPVAIKSNRGIVLAFDAPADIAIYREEIQLKIDQEQEAA